MKKYLFLPGLILFLFACKNGASNLSNCPKLEDLQKTVSGLQEGIKLERVEKVKELPGICEVVVKLSDFDRALFYTDPSGKYIITGQILEVPTRKNLTQERLAFLNKRVLPKETLSELEKRVAFVYGNPSNSNYVYFITDPDCPYCKQAESILESLVKEGKLSVKVILFPLEPLHPKAKEKAISILCDKKGFEGLKTGYISKNQCEEGRRKIEESFQFLQKIGVRGTPTFVFPDGEMKSGVLSPEFILNKLERKP